MIVERTTVEHGGGSIKLRLCCLWYWCITQSGQNDEINLHTVIQQDNVSQTHITVGFKSSLPQNTVNFKLVNQIHAF